MKKIEKETIEKWIKLYKSGKSTFAISKEFEVAQSTVWTHLNKLGIVKKCAQVSTKMIKEWISLYETGDVNIKWIAKKYGISRNVVSKYLRLNGVKTTNKVVHKVEI